jgi:mannose-6-phosphate isomerase-like protein (cupin superfamily)
MEATVATDPGVRLIGPDDGDEGFLGSIGVRFMVDQAESGGGFSLVEHKMSPRALAAPLHRHMNEDEYSFVLEGQVGALLGERVVSAGPGTLIFKPRNQWHTFWNDGEGPATILEIISPAGFEQFFREILALGGIMKADPHQLGALCAQYGLEMDPSSVPSLVERFGLNFPGEPLLRHK